jgi:GDPmannose 4,6-dehydratase
MKKAFITGVTGQDGSYLAEFLLEKGYEVHGLIRRSSSINDARLKSIFQEPNLPNRNLFLHYGDLADSSNLTNLLRKISPDEIYNLGAQSHVRVSFEIPDYTGDITGLGSVRILEAIRNADLNCRFYQASSSELFGSTLPPQNEQSKFQPRSPYAISKLFAFHTVVNYREAYGIHAVNGILFNHESPRRGETFLTRKVTLAAARIALGVQDKLVLGNLDAVRDWGYAPEYVQAMWAMLQSETPADLVIATGIGATVREWVDTTFKTLNLNYEEFIDFSPRYLRPTEVDQLIGDASLAANAIGWKAKTMWKDLSKIMVESDLALVEKQLSGTPLDELRLNR